MALTATSPSVNVRCDEPGCEQTAVVQIGVGFACLNHSLTLAHQILDITSPLARREVEKAGEMMIKKLTERERTDRL